MGGIEGVMRGSKVDEAEGLRTVAAELRQPLAAAIDAPADKLIALLVNGMALTNHLNKVLIKDIISSSQYSLLNRVLRA
jgi:hypothetical protein